MSNKGVMPNNIYTILKNLSFAIGKTSFNAKITRYNLNGDMPYVTSIRLVQDGKSTLRDVRYFKTFTEAVKNYAKGLGAMDITEYNVVINALVDLHLKKITKKLKDDSELKELGIVVEDHMDLVSAI